MKYRYSYFNKKLNGVLIIYIGSLILTTAKGLRFGGNVGYAELILLCFSLFQILFIKIKNESKTFIINNLFWYIVFFTLLAGMLIRISVYSFPDIFPRTFLAYIFCYFVTMGIFNILSAENNIYIMKTFLFIMCIIASVFAVTIVLRIRTIAGINLYWMDTYRFQGWSLDPNQFVIPFIVLPFFSAYFYEKIEKTLKSKIILLISLFLFGFIAMATDSDSLLVAWGGGLMFFVSFYAWKKIKWKEKVRILFVLFVAFALVVGSIVLVTNYENVKEWVFGFMMKDGQLQTRLSIWKSSMDIIKLSPLVGLGSDVGRDIGRSDIMGESHNNFLHLGMSSGLLGITALLIYYLYIFRKTLKSKNALLIGAFISLFVFGLTHYTLRHPSYWFMLLLIDGLSLSEQKFSKKVL